MYATNDIRWVAKPYALPVWGQDDAIERKVSLWAVIVVLMNQDEFQSVDRVV